MSQQKFYSISRRTQGKVSRKECDRGENKTTEKTTKKNSLEVCFQFAFCAEARVPSSALESRAKVSVVVVLVHVEAAEKRKRKICLFSTIKIDFLKISR